MGDISINKVQSTNFEKMMPISFRRLGDVVVVVNDYGNYIFLSNDEFKILMEDGPSCLGRDAIKELKEQNFIFTRDTSKEAAGRLRNRFIDAARVTNLHIIIMTLRCNLSCVYCQASAIGAKNKETDMTIETARQVVDTIFQAPTNMLNIEFQGGEPLLNWDTLKFIIEYATELNKEHKRLIKFNLVSNHLLMDEEKLDFLARNKVVICMSLDGPAQVHNQNRCNSYDRALKMFKKVTQRYLDDGIHSLPSLIGTVTKQSLPYVKEIVDEYISLNASTIFMRPTTTMGIASKNWEKIGLSPDEFLGFYEELIDYILKINLEGTRFTETFAIYILCKIIAGFEPGYVDMKSPCGAAIGQLAYNYNGDVYTCDEGRMLGHLGDHTFRIGKCGESSYSDLIMHRATKACMIASTLETTPGCSTCAYKPYCGICPVINYYETGELAPNVYTTSRHTLYEGIIDILFKKLLNPEYAAVFIEWIKDYTRNSRIDTQLDPEPELTEV